MSSVPQENRNKLKDLFFFIFLFSACLIGSIFIFLIAIGVEEGHPIVVKSMEMLLENAVLITVLFMIFNILLIVAVSFIKKRREQNV